MKLPGSPEVASSWLELSGVPYTIGAGVAQVRADVYVAMMIVVVAVAVV